MSVDHSLTPAPNLRSTHPENIDLYSIKKGFNCNSLAFYTSKGPADSSLWWQNLGSDKQREYKEKYNAAGIKLFVSLFGGSVEEEKITENVPDPVPLATEIGNWVKENNLDGVDVDYEGFSAMIAGTGEKWVISFQKQLRSILPSPQYLICHTPVAWWFVPNRWPGGGYTFVHQQVGDTIDWYNVQFYNVNDIEYTSTCKGLVIESSSQYPKTSLFEIAMTASIPLDKLVIGKPPTKEDAGHGTMDPNMLARCIWAAKMMGWNGGVMGWRWPNANSSWMTTVRSQAFPVESQDSS
ncbi:glycoside hydrolase family 18 protein [Dendrothele bispora CBS 962.96]|uniref:Glycoside hydrolase family 18 protein n=1 Tax=Dendrothele bispora (strain CBS 962.96) TaxID=1314807 RepID=A0A4S8LA99_DENBC|nr:glycoside hydrolase family 18 protein [Dendrothele bispora CBS 962.96]